MESEILVFEEVAKAYGDVRALHSLSFAVERDEIVAMLGPNGAGKTTALEIVLGLRDADAGRVRLFGTSPRDVATRHRFPVRSCKPRASPPVSLWPTRISVW